MSLFRIAIVLSLGVALMPSDREQQEQLYEKAASAAHWTLTFCDRNVQTCDSAGVVWGTFLKKAEFAGRMAYDIAQRAAVEGPAVSPGDAPVSKASGTLKPGDLEPVWRGSRDRGGA
jgi:hypothetical protein